MCESDKSQEKESSLFEKASNPFNGVHPKIKVPRPPNAFMLFGQDYRKVLKSQYPDEPNQSISVRLGQMWKNLPKLTKEEYFCKAHAVNEEHRKKYPGYVYNPKEARARKKEQKSLRTNEHFGSTALKRKSQIYISNSKAVSNNLNVNGETEASLEKQKQDENRKLDIQHQVCESMGLGLCTTPSVYQRCNLVEVSSCDNFDHYYSDPYLLEEHGTTETVDQQSLMVNDFNGFGDNSYWYADRPNEDPKYTFNQGPYFQMDDKYCAYSTDIRNQNDLSGQYVASDYVPMEPLPNETCPQYQIFTSEDGGKEQNNDGVVSSTSGLEYAYYSAEDIKSDSDNNGDFLQDENFRHKQDIDSTNEGVLYCVLD